MLYSGVEGTMTPDGRLRQTGLPPTSTPGLGAPLAVRPQS